MTTNKTTQEAADTRSEETKMEPLPNYSTIKKKIKLQLLALFAAFFLLSHFWNVRSVHIYSFWNDVIIPSIEENVTVVVLDDLPTPKESTLANLNHTNDDCLRVRGSSGKWLLDWEYANRSDYPNYGSYSTWHRAAQNFTQTPGQPFRLAASWRWQDDHCPVHEVERQAFCQACHDLGVKQILVVGDSLSIEFMQSLQSLLGIPPRGVRATNFNSRFKPSYLMCPQTKWGLTFKLYRASAAEDWLDPTQSQSRSDFIQTANDKTVIIANMGAWMKTKEEYHQAFHAWLHWLDSLDANKIIPFFRPTVPGHLGCKPMGDMDKDFKTYDWKHPVLQTPYKDYAEYATDAIHLRLSTNQSSFQWDEFEEWNLWSWKLLQNRSNIHWLNIYNSTVLRRDGHIGFTDCLHYYLPGPIDWWAHFLHSALMDLARIS